jgi:hypothetical protein
MHLWSPNPIKTCNTIITALYLGHKVIILFQLSPVLTSTAYYFVIVYVSVSEGIGCCTLWTRSSLFWDVTQARLGGSCLRFETVCRSHLRGFRSRNVKERDRLEDTSPNGIITVKLTSIRWRCVGWKNLAENRDKCWALVNIKIKFLWGAGRSFWRFEEFLGSRDRPYYMELVSSIFCLSVCLFVCLFVGC